MFKSLRNVYGDQNEALDDIESSHQSKQGDIGDLVDRDPERELIEDLLLQEWVSRILDDGMFDDSLKVSSDNNEL